MARNIIVSRWEDEAVSLPPIRAARQLLAQLQGYEEHPRLQRLLRILIQIGEDEEVMRKRLRELDP